MSPTPQPTGDIARCPACGSPVAEDQRYCLECGERRVPSSAFLRGADASAQPASPPAPPPSPSAPAQAPQSPNTALTVIAGVGVLLLAMGIGVLIGRGSGGSTPANTTPQVISVSSAGTGAPASGEAEFHEDWPSGTTGYTIELQKLAQSGTAVSAVEAAKAAAEAKGAKEVGALVSENFSSLTAGSYVIYSGVYHSHVTAAKALNGLKSKFPGAKVVSISNGSSSKSGGGGSSKSGVGSSVKNPAPPSVLPSANEKGSSYEKKSKELPDVISTG